MPSILDYFENPQFLNSVIGGDGGGMSFDQPKAPMSSVIGQGWGGVDPQPPAPPPPHIMAQPPMGMNPEQFNNSPGQTNGPVPMPPPNPFAAPPPPMPRPKPMDMAPQPPMAPPPQKFEGGIFGGMGGEPIGWKDMAPDGPVPGNGNPPPMVPEADPAAPGNALAFVPDQPKGGYPYVDPPGLNLRGGPIAATADPAGFTRAKHEGVFGNQATPDRAGDELTITRTPRNGTSLDDDQLARPTPVGNPTDLRSPAQSGQADPRIARAREFGTFLQGIGKGLSAPKRPGAGKGASFNAGAGGALLGIGEQENKNLDRDEKGYDRAEKRREHDQTFDYRNRTLDANKDYHDKLIQQHTLTREENTKRYDADREERTARYDADRDERSGRKNWKMVGTENGNPIYRNMTTNEKVVGDEKLDQKLAATRGGRAGDFQFDHKYNAYLAVHPEDRQGALDYANGHKKMSAAESNAAALKLAQDDLKEERRTNPGKFNKMSDDQKKKYLDDLAEDNRKRLRGERAYTQPSARDPDKNLPVAPPPPAAPPPVRTGPDVPRGAPPPVTAAQPPNAPNAPAAPPVPKPPSAVPTRPPHVPYGSVYSPKLGVYMTPDGQMMKP